jgi:hypothetical protein
MMLKKTWRSEPVAITTLVTALLNLLVEFGWDLTVSQRSAVLAASLALAGVVMRQTVWSPEEHDQSLLSQDTTT